MSVLPPTFMPNASRPLLLTSDLGWPPRLKPRPTIPRDAERVLHCRRRQASDAPVESQRSLSQEPAPFRTAPGHDPGDSWLAHALRMREIRTSLGPSNSRSH